MALIPNRVLLPNTGQPYPVGAKPRAVGAAVRAAMPMDVGLGTDPSSMGAAQAPAAMYGADAPAGGVDGMDPTQGNTLGREEAGSSMFADSGMTDDWLRRRGRGGGGSTFGGGSFAADGKKSVGLGSGIPPSGRPTVQARTPSSREVMNQAISAQLGSKYIDPTYFNPEDAARGMVNAVPMPFPQLAPPSNPWGAKPRPVASTTAPSGGMPSRPAAGVSYPGAPSDDMPAAQSQLQHPDTRFSSTPIATPAPVVPGASAPTTATSAMGSVNLEDPNAPKFARGGRVRKAKRRPVTIEAFARGGRVRTPAGEDFGGRGGYLNDRASRWMAGAGQDMIPVGNDPDKWNFGDGARDPQTLIARGLVTRDENGNWVTPRYNFRGNFDNESQFGGGWHNRGYLTLAALAAGGVGLEGLGAGAVPAAEAGDLGATGAFDVGGSAGFGGTVPLGAEEGAAGATGAFDSGAFNPSDVGLDTAGGPPDSYWDATADSGQSANDASGAAQDPYEVDVTGNSGTDPITGQPFDGAQADASGEGAFDGARADGTGRADLFNARNMRLAGDALNFATSRGSRSNDVGLIPDPAYSGDPAGGNPAGGNPTGRPDGSNSALGALRNSGDSAFAEPDPADFSSSSSGGGGVAMPGGGQRFDSSDTNWAKARAAYQPLEQMILDEATKAGSASEQEAKAGVAAADVAQKKAQALQALKSRMVSQGYNPNDLSGEAGETRRLMDLDAAKASVGAQNVARRAERDSALAKKKMAADIGLQASGQAAQLDNMATNASIAAAHDATSAGIANSTNASRAADADAERRYRAYEARAGRAFTGSENAAQRNFTGTENEANRGLDRSRLNYQNQWELGRQGISRADVNARISQGNRAANQQDQVNRGRGIAAGINAARGLYGLADDSGFLNWAGGFFADGGRVDMPTASSDYAMGVRRPMMGYGRPRMRAAGRYGAPMGVPKLGVMDAGTAATTAMLPAGTEGARAALSTMAPAVVARPGAESAASGVPALNDGSKTFLDGVASPATMGTSVAADGMSHMGAMPDATTEHMAAGPDTMNGAVDPAAVAAARMSSMGNSDPGPRLYDFTRSPSAGVGLDSAVGRGGDVATFSPGQSKDPLGASMGAMMEKPLPASPDGDPATAAPRLYDFMRAPASSVGLDTAYDKPAGLSDQMNAMPDQMGAMPADSQFMPRMMMGRGSRGYRDGARVRVKRRPRNFDSGGEVHGPGSSTSDSIRAHLSDGEHVLNAEAVELMDATQPGALDELNQKGLMIRTVRQRMRDHMRHVGLGDDA
jgi:hypothetical protein